MEEQDSLPPAPGAGAATDDAGVTEAAPSGLGKRGLKRLQREEMWREKKAAAAAARAEKRAAQEQARAQREAVAPPTEEELAAAEQRREERIAKRKEGREAFVKLCGEGARIVIDCGWDADLSDKELKSLTQQLMHLYSSNKKAAAPSTVVLTELGPRLRGLLEHVTGIEDWLGFRMEAQSYLDLFPPKEKLVYLTSDSTTTLEAWDRSATYIIGGIVDRNRLKGATMRKAERQGIATARFPLQEHVQLSTSPVLTVNHVFSILLEYQRSGDWLQSFMKVLPQRKRLSFKTASGPQQEQQQEEEHEVDGAALSAATHDTDREEEN